MDDYDSMTPAERAKVDVERKVWDFCTAAAELCALRAHPHTAQFFTDADEATMGQMMTRLQLQCSQPKRANLTVVRAS